MLDVIVSAGVVILLFLKPKRVLGIKSKTRFHHPMRERGFTGYRIANVRI